MVIEANLTNLFDRKRKEIKKLIIQSGGDPMELPDDDSKIVGLVSFQNYRDLIYDLYALKRLG